MAQTIQVKLEFNANTTKAKQQMQELQNQLNLLASNQPVNQLGITKELYEAQTAAMQLKIALNNAMNQDTGKLNLNKLQAQLKSAGMSIQQLSTQFGSMGSTGIQAFSQLSALVAQADTRMFSLGTKAKSLVTSIAHSAQYQLASGLIYGAINGFSQLLNYATELDTSLNNIRIVTGKTADEMARFAKEANKAAKDLSTSTVKYTDASLIYYQQGLSDQEVKERTETTIKLANVSGETASEVSEWMTAIWNNFDNGSKSLEYYADVLAKLGAATASSADEIATGLEKFAAVADTVGLSYEYAASALATITAETRQSADVVGTALKTLFARIEGLKFGDTLEDGTTLNQYSLALEKIGVNIKDANNNLKDMDTILNETGARWNALSKDQQVALAQSVAGIRQYTQFMALMDNWDVMQSNLEITERATGALENQQSIYEESVKASKERLSAQMEEFKALLVGGEDLTKLYDTLTKIMEFVTDITDAFGGLKGILLSVVAALTNMYQPQIATMFQNIAISLKDFGIRVKHIFTGKGPASLGEIIQQQVLEQNSQLLNKASGLGGQAGTISIDQEINNLYLERTRLASKLTAEQQQQFDWQIQIISAQKSEVAELEKKVVKQQQVTDSKMSEIENTYGMQAADAMRNVGEQGGRAQANISQATTTIAGLKSKIAIGGSVNTQEVTQLKENLSKNLTEIQSAYRKMGAELPESFSKAKTALSDFTNKGTEEVNRLSNVFNSLEKEVIETNNVMTQQTASQYTTAGQLRQTGDIDNVSTENLINRFQSVESSDGFKNLNSSQQNQVKNIQNNIQAYNKASKSVVTYNKQLKQLEGSYKYHNNLGHKTTKIEQQIISVRKKLAQETYKQNTAEKKLRGGIKALNQSSEEAIITSEQYKQKLTDAITLENQQQSELIEGANATNQLTQEEQSLSRVLQDVLQKLGLVNQQMQNPGPETFASRLSKTLGAVSSLTMAFNMLYSAGESWGELFSGDFSMSKLLSALSSTFMSVMMLVSGYTALAAIQKISNKESVKAAANNISEATTIMGKVGATITFVFAKCAEIIASSWGTGIGIAIAALALIGGAVSSIASSSKENKEEQLSKNTENQEAINENQELAESVNDLTAEYKDLAAAGESTTEVLEQMDEKIPELIDSYKELIATLGSDIDLSNLEKAYEYFKLTGDISQYEQEQEKVDKEIKKAELQNAETGLSSATSLMLSAGKEGYGWENGGDYTFDANSDESDSRVGEILEETFGDMYGGEEYGGDNITFDKTDAGAWIDYYTKLGQAITKLKEEGKENTATYEDLMDEYNSYGDYIEQLQQLQDSAYKLKKEELLSAGTDIISNEDIVSLDEYRNKREELIKKLREEYEWTEAQAEAYLKETAAFGNWEDAVNAFGEDAENRSVQATQIASKWGESTLNAVETWYANLPDDEKTLFIGIDFSLVSGDLDESKLEELLEEQREKMRIATAKEEAIELGADENTFQSYAKILQQTNSNLKENEAGAYEVAAANIRVKKGLEDLNSTWSKSIKKIQENTQGSYEYAEGLSEINEALKTLLGSDWLEVDFTSQHLDEVQALLNGNYEMFEKLQDEAAKYYIDTMAIMDEVLYGGEDAVKQEIDDIQNALSSLLDSLGDPSIGVEMILDNEQYLNTLQAALDAGQITQDQLEEAFRLKGYDVNFTTHQVPGPSQHVTRTYGKGTWFERTIEYDEETTMTVPLIGDSQVSVNGDSKAKTPKITVTRTADETTAKNSIIEENAKDKAVQIKDLDDELDRYHEINEIIENTERELDKLADAKDRAYGANKLALMDQEIAKQKEMLANNERLLAEAEAYYEQNRNALISNYGVNIDSKGNISNYEELQQGYIDRLKAAAGTENYEDIEKEYEAFKDAASKYEESLDKVKDTQQEIINQQNEIIDKALEKVQYEVEFKIEADEFTMEVLEHFLSRLEDDAFAAADAISYIGQQMEVTAGQVQTYMDGIQKTLGATLSEAEISKIMSGDLSGIDVTKLNETQIADLKEYASALMEVENQLREQHTAVHEKLTESIEAWNEEFDKNMSKFDKYNAVIENYKNIIDIVGKDRLGISDETIKNMYATQKNVANDQLAASKARKEAAQNTYDELAAAYNEAVDQYGKESEIAKSWKEQMDAAEEDLTDATSEFYDSWQNALQAAADAFAASVDLIVENFEESVSGAYGSLDALQEAFDRQREINERYLEDYEKTYEISKLNRKINQDLAKTTSAKSSKELRDLQEELLALNEEGVNVSERDIQFMQKKYDLLVAEQALRDAQNAKSVVRLQRDSEGNYGYVYTADQSNVDAAQQTYEDAKYNLEKWNEESLMTISEQIITIKQNFAQAIQDIANDTTLNDEERKQKMTETTAYYVGQLQYWTDEAVKLNEYAYQANSQFHMDMADSIDDSIIGQIMPDITDWNALYTKDTAAMNKASVDLGGAIDTMANDIDAAMGKAGTSTDEFEDQANQEFASVQSKAGETAAAVESMKNNMATNLALTVKEVQTFEYGFNTALQNVINKIGDNNSGLIGALQKLIEKAKKSLGYQKAVAEENYNYDGSGNSGGGADGNLDDLVNNNPGGTEEKTYTIKQKADKGTKGALYQLNNGKWYTQTELGLSSPPATNSTVKESSISGEGKTEAYETLSLKKASLAVDDANDVTIYDANGERQKKEYGYITKKNLSTLQGLKIDGYKKLSDGTNLYHLSESFEGADLMNAKTYWLNQTDLHQLLQKVGETALYKQYNFEKLDTGGYTGSWGPEGRLAMLHQKEIVLNAHDTENLLSIVSMVRDMNDRITLNAKAMQYELASAAFASTLKANTDNTLQQEVTIHAEFPNATNHSEIEEAFRNLNNLASQYANRKF